MSRGRAFRREQLRKKKRQARTLWRRWFEEDRGKAPAKWVGVMASTHCRPCSCYLCSGYKKHEPSSRADTIAELRMNEQYQECWEDRRDWNTRLNRLRGRIRWLAESLERAKAELREDEGAVWPMW